MTQTSYTPIGRAIVAALALLSISPRGAAWAQGSGAAEAWPSLPGDAPVAAMAESDDIRRSFWDALLAAPRDALSTFKPVTKRNAWGSWSVSTERGADAIYVIVSPERAGAYPSYAQGSWIIKRSSIDGSFLQAKVFLRSDPGTFARVYPHGTRTRLDVVTYGGVLYREVLVPLSFEELIRSPFSRLRRLTADIVDWELFSPDPALYRELRGLEAAVRERLPELRYADDGAVDRDGRAVLIATLASQAEPAGLNCSGFAKWLVDGLLKPLTGEYLSVASLKERMIEWRGSSFTEGYEERLDPFFGLDWSRALAKATWAAFYPSLQDRSPLSNDVDDAPFALRVKDAAPVNGGSAYEPYADNFDDAGLDVRGLKAALFLLASREPGRFYLAQFNARDAAPPRLRRYYHVAALFPYFDDDGVFRVTVFESAAETAFASLLGRGYEFVKLVRMPAAPAFDPPLLR